jgi:hypothetical protein
MDVDEILAKRTIPNPCSMDWDRMRGDDRIRFCDACGKHVYNITAMTSDEAVTVLSAVRQKGEGRCIRVYHRADGTLTASPCQPALQRRATPWQFTIRAIMTAIAGIAAFLGLARWLSPEPKQPKPPPAASSNIVMGSDAY